MGSGIAYFFLAAGGRSVGPTYVMMTR
jgi:hypothetical protein